MNCEHKSNYFVSTLWHRFRFTGCTGIRLNDEGQRQFQMWRVADQREVDIDGGALLQRFDGFRVRLHGTTKKINL